VVLLKLGLHFLTFHLKSNMSSQSCRDLRNTVKNYDKLVNKYPQNTEYRHKFYSLFLSYNLMLNSEVKKTRFARQKK
jgi:hypothetical protein